MSKSAENGFGADFEGASWLTVAPLDCPNQMTIVALGGLEVCEGGHWLIVMKKESKVPPKRSLDGPPAVP